MLAQAPGCAEFFCPPCQQVVLYQPVIEYVDVLCPASLIPKRRAPSRIPHHAKPTRSKLQQEDWGFMHHRTGMYDPTEALYETRGVRPRRGPQRAREKACTCPGCGGVTTDPRSAMRCKGGLMNWARLQVAHEAVAFKTNPRRPRHSLHRVERAQLDPMPGGEDRGLGHWRQAHDPHQWADDPLTCVRTPNACMHAFFDTHPVRRPAPRLAPEQRPFDGSQSALNGARLPVKHAKEPGCGPRGARGNSALSASPEWIVLP